MHVQVLESSTVERERWLPIDGWEDQYEVSSDGRVRSVGRWNSGTSGPRYWVNERILKTPIGKIGYRTGVFSRGSMRYTFRVHVLVAAAFLGPRPTGLVIRHLNGNPADNRLVNLAYGTRTENNRDAILHGRNQGANKTHCSRNHLLADPNLVGGQHRANGRRICRSCSRATSDAALARRTGKPEVDVDRLADWFYAKFSPLGHDPGSTT